MSAAAYTLHVPSYADPGDVRVLDRADLVRDGFSWGAFLVPALWFLRHRHWWLALAAVAAVVGLAAALWLARFGPGTILLGEIVLHLLLGFEGPSLRRWAYARRGRPAVDVVFAEGMADAEAKSFARWLAPKSVPDPVRASGYAAYPVLRRDPEPVIGLFPDREGRA